MKISFNHGWTQIHTDAPCRKAPPFGVPASTFEGSCGLAQAALPSSVSICVHQWLNHQERYES